MSGFEVKFNVYAENQAEADRATEAIKAFINAKALQGVAVTANKIAEAVARYKDNYFVTNFFK